MRPSHCSAVRLFAAGVLPSNVLRHLDRAVAPLRDDVLRWAASDSMHLTLAFYGEVDPRLVPDLRLRLTRVASRSMPVQLRLAGSGRFGRSVLWMGVQGETGPLRRLAASAAAAGRRVGVEMGDAHGYRPHVTLARSGHRIDLRSYAAPLAEYVGPTWTLSEFALISSQLGAGKDGRPRYETLATFGLTALMRAPQWRRPPP